MKVFLLTHLQSLTEVNDTPSSVVLVRKLDSEVFYFRPKSVRTRRDDVGLTTV